MVKKTGRQKDIISTFCPSQSSLCQLWINKHHPKRMDLIPLENLGIKAGVAALLYMVEQQHCKGTCWKKEIEAASWKQLRSRLNKLNQQCNLLNTQSSLLHLYLAAVSRLMDSCPYPVSAAWQGALSHLNSCNFRPLATKVKLQKTCHKFSFQMVLLLL